MMKRKVKHQESGKIPQLSIHDLGTADFSDDSDSDSSNDYVVMLSWNSGKVSN